MLYKNQSLIAAENVINLLRNEDDMENVHACIEAYQNGREHGFTICDFNSPSPYTAYYVCVHRRSDSITVYKGTYSMQSISDDAYENANSFGYDAHKAARWIANELKASARLNKNNTQPVVR